MMNSGYEPVHRLLTHLFEDDQATDLVRAYYKRVVESTIIFVPLCSGALFDRLHSTGRHDENPHEITLDDVHGLAYLSVPASNNFVRDVSQGFVTRIASELLEKIPRDLTFAEVVRKGSLEEFLGKKSPASKLRAEIRSHSRPKRSNDRYRRWGMGGRCVFQNYWH